MNLFDLKDKVIIVTGATGVLAGTAADYLLTTGARVVYLGRTQEKLDAAVARAGDHHERVLAIACDVLNREDLLKVRSQVLDKWGRIDALINGAGGNQPGATIGPDQNFFDLNLDDYSKVLDLNLRGTVLPCTVFGETFSEQKTGIIINFSSMAADRTITRVLGYSNAKAGIDNFTRWLAVELALKFGEGIRVNAVAPGFFIADQNRRLLTNEDGSYTERGQSVIQQTPFRRFGEAPEVCGTLHYLLTDASRFVTGTVIPVDGGFSCFSGV
jgi:NAD(P)-dependent dehydrogenase (short-subunit alcohol dehydrogenase family)